jgi:hypothetical protein
MKKVLFILAFACAAFSAGGDSLLYSSPVMTLADGDTFYTDQHWASLRDTISAVVNGRLGNANLASDANIEVSKLDTTGRFVIDTAKIDSLYALKAHMDTVFGVYFDIDHIEADTVWVDGCIKAATHEGALTGNVTGNVTGDLTGNVTGNVTGDLTGDVTGTADSAKGAHHLTGGSVSATTGNFSSAVTVDTLFSTNGIMATAFTGDVIGNITGNITGNVTGSVFGDTAHFTGGILVDSAKDVYSVVNGSWKPTITATTGNLPAWSDTIANYKVIGKTVHFSCYLRGDGGNDGTGTDTLRVAAPTKIASDWVACGTGTATFSDGGINDGLGIAVTRYNADYFMFPFMRLASGVENLRPGHFGEGNRFLIFTGTYQME